MASYEVMKMFVACNESGYSDEFLVKFLKAVIESKRYLDLISLIQSVKQQDAV